MPISVEEVGIKPEIYYNITIQVYIRIAFTAISLLADGRCLGFRDKEVQGTCLGMRDKEVKGYMSRNA